MASQTPSNQTSNQTPSNQTPSNQTPSNQTPSNQTPSNQTPSNQTPSITKDTLITLKGYVMTLAESDDVPEDMQLKLFDQALDRAYAKYHEEHAADNESWRENVVRVIGEEDYGRPVESVHFWDYYLPEESMKRRLRTEFYDLWDNYVVDRKIKEIEELRKAGRQQ